LTLLVVYGHQAKSIDDPFLRLAEECVSLLSNRIASGGGIWPVDVFPSRTSWSSWSLVIIIFDSSAFELINFKFYSVKRLPEWFPGAGFKRNAAIWKKKMEEFVDKPYEFVLDEMVCFPLPLFGPFTLYSGNDNVANRNLIYLPLG
jgi:hypothetical protein